jgi:membrane-anchored protein YejM (alkaline phosphatase superfamily)
MNVEAAIPEHSGVAAFLFRIVVTVMAAFPIASPMTAEEFIRAHGEDEDDRYELIEGEACERT